MYDFKKIEEKWQKIWEENKYGQALDNATLPKKYNLIEFPYPSGSGMHLGHVKAYLGLDVRSRQQRMQGFNVLFPIGFDAFGLPAENYAMKVGRHPRDITNENIQIFTRQLKSIGLSFDYSRIINTTDPNYYKWTQWIFLKLFEKGLAYRDHTYVNYCPNCKVVLSNEDSQGGKCDRCDFDVIQKEKDVWFLKITEYADKLLTGLDTVDYPNNVKLSQENWIGKSQGAYVNFKINEVNETLKVYTTRPDTLFGVTFMVIAPEHPLIDNNENLIKNLNDIKNYRLECQKKTEFERTQLNKEKTGVQIEGLTATNPLTNESIPIFIADYVMMGYGTGAIMAVPAHDERDFEFAKKFNVPITQVIAPDNYTEDNPPIEGYEWTKRKLVFVVLKHHHEDKQLLLDWTETGWKSLIGGGIEDNETVEEAALREAIEESGYKNIKIDSVNQFVYFDKFCAVHKKVNRDIEGYIAYAHILDDEKIELNGEDAKWHKPVWIENKKAIDFINKPPRYLVEWFLYGEKAYTGDGILINSDFLNGLHKKEAITKIIEYLEEHKIGKATTQYKMKDWAFNRQRYWGEPIPIVHCDNCGIVPLPETELPLELPELKEFQPGPNGESPLANITDWVNCKCPKCNGNAKRETDTMPQWAGSSWYYLRYCDPFNKEEICSKEKMNYWMNVDVYNGGAEHITRHMIYSRFWHHFLYDIGIVNTPEPYKKRTTQGLILGSDGVKMSKSKGNVINPDDIITQYGADVLRCYVLFMGDYAEESPWNEQGVKGISRFLERSYRLSEILNNNERMTQEFEVQIHKTIKKVGEDIENLKYNTAIAELMKLINTFYDKGEISKKDFEVFLKLLSPFAPYISEELNEKLGNKPLITASWPEYDEAKTIDSKVTIAISINGKLRATIEVEKNTNKEELISLAKKQENIKKYLNNATILKEIVVPNKIVNIVIKN